MSYHIVSNPEQVREVLRRSDDFVPTNALTSVGPLSTATLRVLNRARFSLPPVLASASGEQHRRVRGLVARFFTPEKVSAVRPRVVALTRECCRNAAQTLATGASGASGAVDLAAVAQPIPPAIMAELTGVGCPQLAILQRWSRDSLELFWGWPDERRQLELARSATELYTWLREQVLNSHGLDSLFSALRAAGLSVADTCSLGYFLVIAGQETTSQLINIALYRALEDGQSWRQFSEGAPATDFVRGVLASESPVHTWRRTAKHDTQLNGAELPAGAEILLELTGNHPADAPPTAYALAFGYGLHRCLGAKLAELETVAVLEEAARALPGLTLTGPKPPWLRLLSFQTPLTVHATRGTR